MPIPESAPPRPLGLKPLPKYVGAVTPKEIQATHDRLRAHMKSRASTFRQNFKRYDKDNSGAISYAEAAEMLMKLNLHDVRPECLNHIFKMADSDGNGELDYTEFCTLLMAEDTLSLGKKRISSSRVEGGPWLPQGGRQLSDLAVTLRQNASLQRVNSASSLTHSTSHGSLAAIPVASTFVKGKPFDRNMWLERTRMRRQEEQLARQQPMLRTFATTKIPVMSYEEGLVAVKFYKDGGDAWRDWSRVHWKMNQPTSKPVLTRVTSSPGLSPLR